MPKFLKNRAKTVEGLIARFNALISKLEGAKDTAMFPYQLLGRLQELKDTLFLLHVKKANNFSSYLRRYLETVQQWGDDRYEASIGMLGLPNPDFSLAIQLMSEVYYTSRKYNKFEPNSLLDLMYLLETKYNEAGDEDVLSQLDDLITEAQSEAFFNGENVSATDKIQWHCHLISQELRQESPNQLEIVRKFQMCNLLIGQMSDQIRAIQRTQNWIDKVNELKREAGPLPDVPSPAFFKEQGDGVAGQRIPRSGVPHLFNP